MESDTASLRKAAPNWSLAGDKQLLGMLQQIHQSIMTKCQEANTKLDAMVDALDNASIDLQNVNNKFMALSNSQFIESRVYDDDVDIKGDETVPKQEAPQVQPESELQKIKRCLQKLEMMHEAVLIMDSDSSDDEESSMVLKPKDMYGHRPVPHIIGSHAWKSKWHAGLLPEDSDSDSSLSKRDNAPAEEYSDSEPEIAVDVTDKHAQRTMSSSSMESEVLSRSSHQVSSPAAVAAELARRLAGPASSVPEPETMLPPEPAARKVYGIDKPTPATIFPNEPPPLDSYESDRYSDDDIFAELHKKSNQNSFRDPKKSNFANNIVEELFGDSSKDIGNVVPDYVQPHSTMRRDSPLFDEALPPITNKDKPTVTETNIKKPVGGISLFGSNIGAESIGAAILKRQQRKSTSDEDSDVTDSPIQTQPIKEPVKDNKKIIEDLFTKPAVKKKDIATKKIDNVKPVKDKVEDKPKESKIDLFSDNLFDDIDDIFTTNVTKPKIDNTKSIFDDDDLFSDVVEQTDKRTDRKDTTSIFDSDDDLFNDNDKTLTIDKETSNTQADTHTSEQKSQVTKKVKSIFDDNSDDDLFSDNITKKDIKVTELIKEKDIKYTKPIDNKPTTDIPKVTSDDKLFSNKSNSNVTQSTLISNNILNNTTIPSKQFQSPNLFDDDDDYDLFTTEQDVQTVLKTPKVSKSIENYHDEEDEIKRNENVESDSNSNNSVKDLKHSDNLETSQQNISYDSKEAINAAIKQLTEPSTSNYENVDSNNLSKKNVEHDNVISKEKPETIQEKEVKILEQNEVIDEINKDSLMDEDFMQEEPLFSEPVATESKEPDIFSDIFNDLPPAFEKPIESKKSKNVNALFDDDSDDEALFFKKNDVISDEKPDLDFSSDRFRIFHDEPPDIDVDFSQKPLNNANSVISEKHIDDLFNEIPQLDNNDTKHEIEEVTSTINKEIYEKEETITPKQNKDSKDTIENEPTKTVDITKLLEDFSDGDTKPVNISKLLEEDDNITSPDISEETNSKSESKVEQIIQNIEENKPSEPESKDTQNSEEDSPKKSIGKLKPMNFNINVNTLLPGASPKKSKASEETDGQTISTKNNEEVQSPNTETKMVKSVSFDGDPDSGVLDNKLSKERAKIQVKRRPSTRRARLEAVRKSGIDFGSDSTDNSSSFDEPKPKVIDSDVDNTLKTTEKLMKTDSRDQDIDKTTKATTSEKSKNMDIKPVIPIDNTILDNTVSNSKKEDKTDNLTNVTKPEIKSKVVYILNDEDIFSNTSSNTTLKIDKVSNTNIEKIDQNYKDTPKKDLPKDRKDDSKEKKEKPLFDDLSDEELFGKKPVKPKESLFDSDSDGELFSKKVRLEQKKETAKVSLFGDESDDDDLFASKTTKVTDTKPLPKQTQTTNKPTEPVFEDPLSMLGEDES